MLRQLGRTGIKVSPICLGTMNFGGPTTEADAIRIIHTALDGGINFVDTANVYQRGESERILGKALKLWDNSEDVILATKVYSPMGNKPNDRGGSRRHIMQSCEASLKRLQIESIDLYQLHRADLEVPQEETLRAFDDLIRQGKVRHIGCSTHPAWKVMEALAISEKLGLNRYVSEQPPYNLLDRRIENELLPLCQEYGLAVLPWSPVAGGVLTGRYSSEDKSPQGSRADLWGRRFNKRVTARGLEVAAKLAEMAEAKNMSTSQLALLWVKEQPGITAPIYGPRTLAHLEDALGILETTLSKDELGEFDKLVPPGNAVADFHDSNNWMKARIIEQETA